VDELMRHRQRFTGNFRRPLHRCLFISARQKTDMDKSDQYLFVYGSLRKRLGHPRHKVLDRYAELLGNARFRGKLYMVKNYPGAVKTDNPEARVVGELYRLHHPEKVFSELDPYEGYEPERRNNSLFIRSREVVTLDRNGEKVKAWIYLYNRPAGHLTSIRSGNYLEWAENARKNP